MTAHACSALDPVADNLIPFRFKVTPQHGAYLLRWLAAGRRLGLHDAAVSFGEPADPRPGGEVLIWVRENADPAYLVAPDGPRWAVTDRLRSQVLGRFRSFEAALAFIRPALAEPTLPEPSRPARRR